MEIGKYNFYVEPFHADFTGCLSQGVMGNHLLNVAGMNAEENGFGIDYLNEHHYTWVLSRLVIEMDKMPRQYESFSVETWVESVMSRFSGRCFEVKDSEGKTMGYARSMWAMIDIETRMPANLLTLKDGVMNGYVVDRPCPIDGPGKIRVTSQEPLRSVEVLISDIDINQHMNSVRYIEHVMNVIPLEVMKERRVKRFEIAFVNECVWGDVLEVFCDKSEDESLWMVEIRKKESGEVACRASIQI